MTRKMEAMAAEIALREKDRVETLEIIEECRTTIMSLMRIIAQQDIFQEAWERHANEDGCSDKGEQAEHIFDLLMTEENLELIQEAREFYADEDKFCE